MNTSENSARYCWGFQPYYWWLPCLQGKPLMVQVLHAGSKFRERRFPFSLLRLLISCSSFICVGILRKKSTGRDCPLKISFTFSGRYFWCFSLLQNITALQR